MDTVGGQKVFDNFLSNTLHKETQVEDGSVSLTAGSIYRLADSGDLDFGGSEFQLADRDSIEAEKRNDEDDYGWWELEEGVWILELNETITHSGEFNALLQPHDHLIWNGATHPTLWFDQDDSDMRLSSPLRVPENGLNIKENARVSSLRIYKQ